MINKMIERYKYEAGRAGLDVKSYMLIEAAEHGFIVEAKNLIEDGADVNAINTLTKQCPLELASEKGKTEMVDLLLKNGAHIEHKESFRSALELAAQHGHLDIVALLIKYGAKTNNRERNKTSALELASMNGHNSIVKLLIQKGADVNHYQPALHDAVSNGHTEVVRTLLKGGAMIDYVDRGNVSALETALYYGKKDVAKILIENGANIDGALDKALQTKSTEIVEILLTKEIDFKYKDKYGKTLFMIAATHGELQLMSDLIDKGSDIEEKDNDGMTALMLASRNCCLKAVEMLIEKGANVNEKSNGGLTALMFAITTNAYLQRKDVVKKLIESGSCVNERSKDGSTALMFATMNKDTDSFTALVDNGADLNMKRNNGDTALILAITFGCLHLVEVLIDRGADVNVIGMNGLSPRQIALGSSPYKSDLLKILEKKSSISKIIVKENESLHKNMKSYETMMGPEDINSDDKISINQSADPLQILTTLPLDTGEHMKCDKNDTEVFSKILQLPPGQLTQEEVFLSEAPHTFPKQLKKRKRSKSKRNRLVNASQTISKGHGSIVKDNKRKANALDQGDVPCKESHGQVFADNTATASEDSTGSKLINTLRTELKPNSLSEDTTTTEFNNLSRTQLTNNIDIAAEDKASTKCSNIASTELTEYTAFAIEDEAWIKCTDVNQILLESITEQKADIKTGKTHEWTTSLIVKILQEISEFNSASKMANFDTGQCQLYPVIIKFYHIERVDHAQLQQPLNVNIENATYCVIDGET